MPSLPSVSCRLLNGARAPASVLTPYSVLATYSSSRATADAVGAHACALASPRLLAAPASSLSPTS